MFTTMSSSQTIGEDSSSPCNYAPSTRSNTASMTFDNSVAKPSAPYLSLNVATLSRVLQPLADRARI